MRNLDPTMVTPTPWGLAGPRWAHQWPQPVPAGSRSWLSMRLTPLRIRRRHRLRPRLERPGATGCVVVRGGRLVAATVIVGTAAATVTCCRSPPHCASLVASEGDPWIVLTAPDQRLCDGVPSATSTGRFPRKSASQGLPSADRREHETEDKTLGANAVHQLGVLVESIIRHRASPLIHHRRTTPSSRTHHAGSGCEHTRPLAHHGRGGGL